MNALVEELFHQVVDLPPAARAHFFAAHHVDDNTRREVEALLAFESSASALLAEDIAQAAHRMLPQLDATGSRCGPYHLIEMIGRGGMGAVYLAERVDGELRQRVAIKLLPPGAGDLQCKRFLRERQILSTLAHPNIARLFDAGHVDGGLPFLVMEYIEGRPIDQAAGGRPVPQVIGLFLKACAAVAYMHRHQVVHRDLKPANILVTPDGEPKVLDFGIAKLLDVAAEPTESGQTTSTMNRMLTPAYASPEQVMGGKLSTATDIYSLGALLYRLLTGSGPHDTFGASGEGIAAAIGTRDVPRPSTWKPELKGDLDCILLKALCNDPRQRYQTVEQLSEDLQAYLESRPVRARDGNAWYRARRFARRNRVPVTAAIAVAATLAIGLQLVDRQRVIAQRRSDGVRQLANSLFDIDKQVSQLSGSTQARQLIVDTSLAYLHGMSVAAEGNPDLTLEVATAYMAVAQVEGIASGSNLGQIDEADRDLQIADGLVRSVLKAQPANRTALLRLARLSADRMLLASQRERRDDALRFGAQSARALEQFNAVKADEAHAATILGIYSYLAHAFMLAERFDDTMALCNRGIWLAQLYGRPLDLGMFLATIGLARQDRGDLEGALEAIDEATRLATPAPDDTRAASALNYALMLTWRGWIFGMDEGVSFDRTHEAVADLERAYRIFDGLVHTDPNNESTRRRLFMAAGPLADILRRRDAARALTVYDHALSDMGAVDARFLQLRSVFLLAGSSYPLRAAGRTAEARHRIDRAFASLRELKLYPSEEVAPGSEAAAALRALADDEADNGRAVRAAELYQDLLDRLAMSDMRVDDSLRAAVYTSHVLASAAALHRRNGRADRAAALDTQRSALWRHWHDRLPRSSFVARQLSAPVR